MLILSRRAGESIIIGDNTRLTIIAIDRNQVRLGIDAPKETTVHREEVYNRIKAENGQPPAPGVMNSNEIVER